MKAGSWIFCAFLLVACGSGKDADNAAALPAKVAELDVNTFVNEVYAANGLPVVGSAYRFLVPHIPSGKEDCVFWAYNEVKLESVKNNEMTFSVNQIFTPSKQNPEDCGVVASTRQEEKYSLESYLGNKKRQLRNSFSAEKWCRAYSSFCSSAELTKSEDVDYKGQRARYVEYSIRGNSGKNYTRKAWISKQSLLLGEFEFELVTSDTNEWLDFRDYLNK